MSRGKTWVHVEDVCRKSPEEILRAESSFVAARDTFENTAKAQSAQPLDEKDKRIKELERQYTEAENENSYARQIQKMVNENKTGSTQLMKQWLKET